MAGGALSASHMGLRQDDDVKDKEESVHVCLCVCAEGGVRVQVAGVG
jgi:hypothetical protein